MNLCGLIAPLESSQAFTLNTLVNPIWKTGMSVSILIQHFRPGSAPIASLWNTECELIYGSQIYDVMKSKWTYFATIRIVRIASIMWCWITNKTLKKCYSEGLNCSLGKYSVGEPNESKLAQIGSLSRSADLGYDEDNMLVLLVWNTGYELPCVVYAVPISGVANEWMDESMFTFKTYICTESIQESES